jgi:hypothetical protein
LHRLSPSQLLSVNQSERQIQSPGDWVLKWGP